MRTSTSPAPDRTTASAAEDGPTARRRVEPVVFGVFLLLQLVPLVLLPHLGTQDGPSHLATARVLLDYGDPAHPIYEQYYWLDAFPSPNLLTEGLLPALVAVFPPEVAEKILSGGYLLALPLALRFVLRRIDPSATWLAYAAFPLADGFLFVAGFSNYCYGVVVFVLAAGWILTPRRRSGLRYVLVLAGWLLLAYLTHFVPAALLALLTLVPPLAEARAAAVRRLPTVRDALRRLGPTLLGLLPFAVLTLLFLSRPAPGESRRDNPLGLLLELPLLVKAVVALSYAEYPAAIALGLALVALVVVVLRRRGRASLSGPAGWVATGAGLCSVVYLLAPESTAQGGAINARLSIFPPLLVLLWLGWQSRTALTNPRLRAGAMALFVVVWAVIAVVRWPIEVRHSEQVEAYVQAADLVRPNSTILGLQYESANVPKVRGFSDPTLHGSSLVAVLRHGVDVGHYEAELTYFPTRFRSENNLPRQIDATGRGLYRTPTPIRTLRGPDGRGLVDYVLVRGDPSHVPPSGRAAAQRITDELVAYRLIGTFGERTGAGTAEVRLYERR